MECTFVNKNLQHTHISNLTMTLLFLLFLDTYCQEKQFRQNLELVFFAIMNIDLTDCWLNNDQKKIEYIIFIKENLNQHITCIE